VGTGAAPAADALSDDPPMGTTRATRAALTATKAPLIMHVVARGRGRRVAVAVEGSSWYPISAEYRRSSTVPFIGSPFVVTGQTRDGEQEIRGQGFGCRNIQR
jgi:hypothetical protein